MYWFWIGFFVFVAICLAIDLGIGSRQSTELSFKSALKKTIVWVSLGKTALGPNSPPAFRMTVNIPSATGTLLRS